MSTHFTVTQLREHAKNTQSNPIDRKVTYAALRAYEKLRVKSDFSEEDLLLIVKAAFHAHRGPMYIGCELLIDLSEESIVVQQIWRQKSRSSRATERRIAAACMYDRRVPRSLALEVVTGALDDKSLVVREFARSSGRARGLSELHSRLKTPSH